MKNNSILRKTKILFWKLARSRDSTQEIALGAAIGTFISVFPTFGFGTLFVILLTRFLKFNLIIAFATSIISNPFTSPFFMLLSYKIGKIIIGNNIHFDIKTWKNNLGETGLTVLVGSFLLSTLMGVTAYFISKYVVTKYRERKK
jgi:uncharacterized protein (DUF2062 family)